MFKLVPILLGIVLIVTTTALPEGDIAVATQGSKSERSATASPSSAAPPLSSAEGSSQDDDEDDNSIDSAGASLLPAASTSVHSSIHLNSPAELAATAKIQHHVLPAEVIPLPLTISTRPGLRTIIAPETITIHQPAVAKIGELVQNIPTAVSHQSQTIVHKHARVVTPIVAPAVRTLTSQVVRAYHTPLVIDAEAPVVKVISD